MSPGILGAICLAGFGALWLIDWLAGLTASSPRNAGFFSTAEYMLCIIGVGLVAYHVICFRKYQDDIDPNDDRLR